MIRVFIGYSRAAPVVSSVAALSINRRASQPVAITHLALNQLGGLYTRPQHELQSTDFSFSRFLTPSLAGFQDWAIFMDDDMLVLDDIAKLWALRDDRYAVQVVKHDHVPQEDVKFLDKVQTKYEKKNWSSVMLFNCARCTALTPDYVNSATGLELHQFKWLGDDGLIGEIPHRWNYLADYDPTIPARDISIVHYTLGGPYYDDTSDCAYSDLWLAEREAMLHCAQRVAKTK
ncbi:glycosyltransferase [Ferrovibrio xuzhouensis]|uniref:Glycosyltransferase n=1 Tax=Ferrovibrio xuzhouensis TaxID=1576914 RepID=A0ABV7VM38_9PROT